MSRTMITLQVDASDEPFLRQYAAFLAEMKHLAAAAPPGSVLAVCERAVVEQGREHQRRVLEAAVQARVDAAEKKGRR